MAEARHPRRIGRVIKLTIFALTPALVLVVLAETAATMSITRRARIVVDSATKQSTYTMQIGKWPWSRRTQTPLNSLGLPDVEFPAAGSKQGCTHVVFSGDSYAFGDGVNRDSNFVEIVRRRTATESPSRCIRMFNLGVRGTTIDRQSEKVLSTLETLQPDVVILVQYQNDLTDLTNPGAILDPNRREGVEARGDSIRVRLKIFNANFIKMMTYRAFAVMIQNGIERDVLRHWSVVADTTRRAEAERYQQVYSRLYGQLADTLGRRGIAFGVIIIPSKLDVLARKYPEEPYFIQLAEQHRVNYLRLFPVLDAHRSPYAFLMYDGHLNERGNRLVADAVYDWLFKSDTAPFTVLRAGAPATPAPASSAPVRRTAGP